MYPAVCYRCSPSSILLYMSFHFSLTNPSKSNLSPGLCVCTPIQDLLNQYKILMSLLHTATQTHMRLVIGHGSILHTVLSLTVISMIIRITVSETEFHWPLVPVLYPSTESGMEVCLDFPMDTSFYYTVHDEPSSCSAFSCSRPAACSQELLVIS